MTTTFTPRNSQQKIAEIPINLRSVLQPTTYYTCPSGKKAKIKYRIQGDGLGAAGNIFCTIGGVRIGNWVNLGTASNVFPPNSPFANTGNLQIGSFVTGEVTIKAGDTVVTDQNSGTNAEFNVFLEILELPA